MTAETGDFEVTRHFPAGEALGRLVGNIRIIEKLGQGGMGAVYVGFDTKLERKVALKAIHRERRLNTEARARFLREARILSQLDHPRICRIYDYLENAESDYLVLELVAGQTLRQVGTRGKMPLVDLLRIAEQLAEALVAAHEQGVIHRDLKPDNVMLMPDGNIKVLDFGLAQSTPRPGRRGEVEENSEDSQASISDITQFVKTRDSSDFLLGTLGYMSPEQAQGERVSSASDLYSLGILLQELAVGGPLFDRNLAPALLLVQVAAGQSPKPENLDRDLSELIERLKRLAPASRPTALEALATIRRLRDRPRRRLRRLAAAAISVGLFFLALKYTTDLRRERSAALEARAEAEEVLSFMKDLFKAIDATAVANNRQLTAREMLDRGAHQVRSELQDRPLARAGLLHTIGEIYRNLGLFDEAIDLTKEALQLRQANLAAADPAIAASLEQLALLYWNQGRYHQAVPLCQLALKTNEAHFGPESLETANSLNSLANILGDLDRVDEAEKLYERSLQIRERQLGGDASLVASSLQNLANVKSKKGETAIAELLYLRAIDIKVRAEGPDAPALGRFHSNLGRLYANLGRTGEAEQAYRKAQMIWEQNLGPDHPTVAWALHGLGQLEARQGRTSEARRYLDRALEIREKSLDPGHPLLVETRADLAALDQP